MSIRVEEAMNNWPVNGTNGNGKVHQPAAGLRGVQVHRIDVQTSKRMEIHDLTATVQEIVHSSRITAGLVTLSTMHTTTAVFVNEPQTALLEDIQAMLERLVPRGDEWKHNDPRYSDCDRQNADSHLRAIMLGSSVTIQVAEGALTMGQWQRILMAELDGPRKRNLVLQVLAVG